MRLGRDVGLVIAGKIDLWRHKRHRPHGRRSGQCGLKGGKGSIVRPFGRGALPKRDIQGHGASNRGIGPGCPGPVRLLFKIGPDRVIEGLGFLIADLNEAALRRICRWVVLGAGLDRLV